MEVNNLTKFGGLPAGTNSKYIFMRWIWIR